MEAKTLIEHMYDLDGFIRCRTAVPCGTLGWLGRSFALSSTAAAAGPDGSHEYAEAVPTAVLTALARDLDLTEKQTRQRLAVQEKATTIDSTLRTELSADTAGSWPDATTGRLTVAVTRADRASRAAAAGADVRVVRRGAAALAAVSADHGGNRGTALCDISVGTSDHPIELLAVPVRVVRESYRGCG
jgi:hypothetical protein